MMIMTAKVDKKKLALAAAGIVVLIVGLVLLFGGGKNDAPTAPTVSTAVSVVGNDDRVHFLNGFGWDVTTSPTESLFPFDNVTITTCSARGKSERNT